MPLSAVALLVVIMAEPLQWQAPAGCPSGSVVRARLAELLGRTPTDQDFQALGVVHVGPPWRVELETTIEGRRQQRALQGEDCRAVTEAAALILAVSMDPVTVSRASPEAPSPASSAVPPPGPQPPERLPTSAASSITSDEEEAEADEAGPSVDDAASVETTPPREPMRPWLSLGAGGEVGAIPGGTGGVRLGVTFESSRALVRVEGSYWIDRFAVLYPSPLAGATVGLGTAAVHGGLRWGGPQVTVPMTLGIEAGGLRSRGDGLSSARTLTLPWLAGVVGTGVKGQLGRRVALWAQGEVALPLLRPSVRVGSDDDGVELHSVAPIAARVMLGLAIALSRR